LDSAARIAASQFCDGADAGASDFGAAFRFTGARFGEIFFFGERAVLVADSVGVFRGRGRVG
jgi:hypothetical protein